MAKPTKTFRVHCENAQATQLADALAVYAHAAYPPGGSECAQVARDALLTSARTIAEDAAKTDGAQLSRRQRGMIKAAVQWYFSDQGPGDAAQSTPLLSLLERKPG
jgi:hypothetical protein